MVEQVHHQIDEAPTKSFTTRAHAAVESDEESYNRTMKIGSEWKRLELGWIERPSMVCIRNDEGKLRQTVPSDEEKIELAGKVVLIGFGGHYAHIEVVPSLSARFKPVCDVFVCCPTGEARVQVMAVPS